MTKVLNETKFGGVGYLLGPCGRHKPDWAALTSKLRKLKFCSKGIWRENWLPTSLSQVRVDSTQDTYWTNLTADIAELGREQAKKHPYENWLLQQEERFGDEPDDHGGGCIQV